MRRGIAALMLLSIAVIEAPTHAQALVSSFFPDVFPIAASEPALLALTGLALLSLGSAPKTRD